MREIKGGGSVAVTKYIHVEEEERTKQAAVAYKIISIVTRFIE